MSDFWSRRKAAVEAERRAEAEAAAAVRRAELEAQTAERTDEELLAELGLPEPESLGEGDDFRPFLGEAIPARLRARALRRLWRVNPVLANLDGLVDYGEDFTDAATVIEGLQTAYQVGRGALAHLAGTTRRPGQGQAGADPQTASGSAAAEGAGGDASAEGRTVTAPGAGAPTPEPAPVSPEVGVRDAAAAEEATLAQRLPARRRMTFVFQDQRTA